MPDEIHRPSHYMSPDGQMEVRDVQRHWLIGIDGDEAYCLGNCIKYLLRYPYKGNPVKDLKKLIEYAGYIINIYEMKEN